MTALIAFLREFAQQLDDASRVEHDHAQKKHGTLEGAVAANNAFVLTTIARCVSGAMRKTLFT